MLYYGRFEFFCVNFGAAGFNFFVLQVLLGYLPRQKDDWVKSLQKSRTLFKEFLQELVIDPRKAASAAADHVRFPNPYILNEDATNELILPHLFGCSH